MLQLIDVSKTFNPGTVNEKKALSHLNLELQDGDFATIIGSNGAGKSTMFNAICGTFFADEGAVILDGTDITYEKEYNGGMGSNGLTSARHDVFAKYLAEKYPESYDKAVPEELVYSGNLKLTDAVEGSPLDAGKLVLSPTRTYAPVVKKLLDALRPEIHGMVHCSGGAQTKVLHFVGNNCRVVKDNLFPVPPLFKTIKEQSGTDWEEMYKVFNMGHRLEVYLSPEHAEEVIAISKSFNIDAKIVGRIEESDKKELIIKSEFGEFKY